jgi:energy-coupling factor transport system ATP-binding protein
VAQKSDALARVETLRWRYSIGDWVLRELTLEIHPGERVGLIGRSGCGKSTLALTFNGIIPHSYAGQMAGRVWVAGMDTETANVSDLAAAVAMVFQSPDDQMSQILVKHELASGPANLGLPLHEVRSRGEKALGQLGGEHLAERETSTLSGGEKQKVALAAALAMQPRLLVLDEPTTDLDPRAKAELIEVLRSLDPELALVIISHDLDTIAPLVNRLIILDAGAIAADEPADAIFAEPSILAAHGIAVPQMLAINHALRRHEPDWPIDSSIDDVTNRFGPRLRSTPFAPAADRAHAEPAIELARVSFRYPDAARPAVREVSLEIGAGELVAIVGNNGSGKTTLSKLMLGLLKPGAGSVRILGQPVERIRPDLVGYIYQNPDAMLSQMSVDEEVAFTPRLLGRADWRDRSRDMLDRFGLTELERRFPLALSKGQRQRLAYAAIAAASPPILIFDEPTTGIDLPGCNQIMEYMDALRREGKTIVFITHDMALATRWADRILVLHAGRIVHAGAVESLAELGDERLAAYHLRLPPLLELVHRIGLAGRLATADQLVDALSAELQIAGTCDA